MTTPADSPAEAPVRIVRARRITTLDGRDTQVFATVGERVAAVGEQAERYAALPGAETVDLGDVHVVPGFHDAHCHPTTLAQTRLRLDLESGDTASPPRARIAARVAATPPGQWIVVERYNPRADPDGRLDRAALDALSAQHPILVIHFSCHMAVAGSRALELGGFHDDGAVPAGGDLDGTRPAGSTAGSTKGPGSISGTGRRVSPATCRRTLRATCSPRSPRSSATSSPSASPLTATP